MRATPASRVHRRAGGRQQRQAPARRGSGRRSPPGSAGWPRGPGPARPRRGRSPRTASPHRPFVAAASAAAARSTRPASSARRRLVHGERLVGRQRLVDEPPARRPSDVRPPGRVPALERVADRPAGRGATRRRGRARVAGRARKSPPGPASSRAASTASSQRRVDAAPEADAAAEELDVEDELLEGVHRRAAEEPRADEQVGPGERGQERAERPLEAGLDAGHVGVGPADRGLHGQPEVAPHLGRRRPEQRVFDGAAGVSGRSVAP